MADYALPALYAVLTWWFATGIILWLDGLPRHTHRWSMAAVSVAGAAGLWLLARSSGDASATGAYAAFGGAVLVWGWLETSFLMGFITGPRRDACPIGSRGLQRFGHATQAVIYHELSIAAAGALVFLLTRDGTNPTGWWTFAVLWAMRLSAKLNLFLGVPNLNDELLPDHLKYLRSYFTKKPMNLLFPLSITASTAAALWCVARLAALDSSADATVGLTLITALLVLAILEHWFMVLPLPVNRLWEWALSAQAPAGGSSTSRTAANPPGDTGPLRVPAP